MFKDKWPSANPLLESAMANPIRYTDEGITILDYFAGQIASAAIHWGSEGIDYREIARDSYDFAEAMVAERARRMQ